MEKKDTAIFAKRLKQARLKEKLSLDALCSRIENRVTKQSLHKYEAGLMLPSSEIMSLLARALNVSIDYFQRPYIFDDREVKYSFRKKSSIGAKDFASLKEKVSDEIERYLMIEQILGIEKTVITIGESGIISGKEDVERLARKLRRSWLLGEGPIANVQGLLESHGIKVVFTAADLRFDGVSCVINGSDYVIVLNSENNHIERRRLTAMHELCHLICDEHFSEDFSQKDKEKMCQAFASEMLLPSDVLRKTFSSKYEIDIREVITISRLYGISVDAIMLKLNAMELISYDRYQRYCIAKKNNQGLKSLVEKSRFVEPTVNWLEFMTYGALAKNLITMSKAASILNCSVSSISQNKCFI